MNKLLLFAFGAIALIGVSCSEASPRVDTVAAGVAPVSIESSSVPSMLVSAVATNPTVVTTIPAGVATVAPVIDVAATLGPLPVVTVTPAATPTARPEPQGTPSVEQTGGQTAENILVLNGFSADEARLLMADACVEPPLPSDLAMVIQMINNAPEAQRFMATLRAECTP